jgi:uncharacterized protein (DUF697 family)
MQQIGVANNLKQMVNVLREVSFDEIREGALREPKVLVFGPTEFDARWLADALLGGDGSSAVSARPLDGATDDLDRYDAVVVFDPIGAAEATGLNDKLRTRAASPAIFRLGGLGAHEQTRIEDLRAEMVRRLPGRAIAIARRFPAMRAAAVKAEIDEVSMANAQFALVSNIPSLIPFVGGLAAVGADLIVLTKNQVLLVYKLAAMHGRNLDDQIGILQEIAPVIGAGFAWRSLARGAATMLPFAAGTIPKVAIAYAGTTMMGRAADFFYRTNRRPSRAQMEQYVRQAQDVAKKLPLPGRENGAN